MRARKSHRECVLNKLCIVFTSAFLLSNCGMSPFEETTPERIEVDGYPFAIYKYKGSNSYAVSADDFFCKKTSCQLLPKDYPKAIKAVELLSGCPADSKSLQLLGPPAVLQISALCED